MPVALKNPYLADLMARVEKRNAGDAQFSDHRPQRAGID